MNATKEHFLKTVGSKSLHTDFICVLHSVTTFFGIVVVDLESADCVTDHPAFNLDLYFVNKILCSVRFFAMCQSPPCHTCKFIDTEITEM